MKLNWKSLKGANMSDPINTVKTHYAFSDKYEMEKDKFEEMTVKLFQNNKIQEVLTRLHEIMDSAAYPEQSLEAAKVLLAYYTK